MIVGLLDALPPGNALNIGKSGMLFLPAELGNHALYQFEHIDLRDAPKCTLEEATAAYLGNESSPKIWEEAKFYALSECASKLAWNEVSPQMYTLNGLTELAVSDLLGNSRAYDKYIVVSFANATLVLSVGDVVEEMGKELGILTNAPTLACSALGHDGGICQVHPAGVRHEHKGQAKQWHCPSLKHIECALANESQ
eukprot:3870011-Ditylum_brightwellii.AAC.1